MKDYILRAAGIKKSFGGVEALKGVDLEVGRGEIHCLAGENGCGKSTLIKVISGFHPADSGTIELDGKQFTRLTTAEAIERGVQVIYQDFSLFPNLTVMENLAITMELSNKRKLINWTRMRSIAQEAMSKIGFKADLTERVENLSIAQKQLIAVCRALLYNAKLIIMDEPTTALTKKEVRALFTVIKNLQADGIATLFVSHKLDEVFEIATRWTIFRNGNNVATGNTSELDDKKFAFYMTGRNFDEEAPPPQPDRSKVVVEFDRLSRGGSYQDISLNVYSGEILGITGLLGSGRTELMQTLFGLTRPDSGGIKINGAKARIRSIKDAIALGIGYVPSDRLTEGLFLPQSIGRNMIVSSLQRFAGQCAMLDMKAMNSEIARWTKELGVNTSDTEREVKTLSGGNQQKVVLARWIANNLNVLILDGPTVGVDIGSKYDIHALLRALSAQGLSVIVISDDLRELLACCGRIIVMRDGRIERELQSSATTEAELGEIAAGNF
ncbi:MAG: sugar ABC transporter ATP-binding protein [Spirochaetaceae bacterium]|jgi:simple sugar transport system ATP-binding protein|nr:sugar ABC transporter ATP-binding protein [Spirochaetaceae bacterium]